MITTSWVMNRLTAALLAAMFLAVGCSGGGGTSSGGGSTVPPTPKSVLISWNANHESAVNRVGGGYKVYYATTPGFVLGNATSVDVPYVSGATAPTSRVLTLLPGTYYIKVTAYSALNPSGGTASSELPIVVPN